MMHVVLCTDGVFPQAMGGMQRHSRLLAEHLARTGDVRLTVLHPHTAPIFDPALGIHEVHVPPIDPGRFYLRELWRYSDRVAAILVTLAPDVVFSQGFCVWKDAHRFTDKLVMHPHGLEMFQGLTLKDHLIGAPFRWVLGRIVRRSTAVISLGGKLTTILQNVAKGSGCRVEVLPNAVDVPMEAPPYPLSDGPLRILFVGRFAFNKGLDVLMAVAQRLEREGRGAEVRFELAGDGPLLKDYQAAGLPSNVQLLGRVDDERLFRLYTECHALLLPTRFEGMPTVVLEAMAHARPIIVSNVGATAELVDATNGFLLPPGSVEALHSAVVRMLQAPREDLRRMGIAGHQRARDRFDWPIVAQRYAELLVRWRRPDQRL